MASSDASTEVSQASGDQASTESPQGDGAPLDRAEESEATSAPLTALKSGSEIDAANIAVLSTFISDVVTHAGGTATQDGPVLRIDLGVELEPETLEAAPETPAPQEASSQDVASSRATEPAEDSPESSSEDEEAAGAEVGEAGAAEGEAGPESEAEIGTPVPSKVVPGSAEDLARRLRRSTLELVFRSEDLTPGRDLVADGSPLIRRLEEFLAAQGARTYLMAPATARLSLKAIDAAAEASAADDQGGLDRASLGLVAAKGESVKLLDRSDVPGFDFYVLYRIRLRALVREDVTACIEVQLRPGIAPDEPNHVTARVAEPPADISGWELKSRRKVPALLRALALETADSCLADHSRELATATQTKLRKSAQEDLKRLHAYYAGQIAEYMRRRSSDLNLIRMEELEAERELRITELIRSAEVRVSGEALSLIIIERPIQRARAVRRTKDEEETELASRWLLFDRSRGSVEWEGELEGGE